MHVARRGWWCCGGSGSVETQTGDVRRGRVTSAGEGRVARLRLGREGLKPRKARREQGRAKLLGLQGLEVRFAAGPGFRYAEVSRPTARRRSEEPCMQPVYNEPRENQAEHFGCVPRRSLGVLWGPQTSGTPGIATTGLFHRVLLHVGHPSVRPSAAFTPKKRHLAACQHRVRIRKKPRRTKLPERLLTEALALRNAKFKLSHDVFACAILHKPALAVGSAVTGWEQEPETRNRKVWLSSC